MYLHSQSTLEALGTSGDDLAQRTRPDELRSEATHGILQGGSEAFHGSLPYMLGPMCKTCV